MKKLLTSYSTAAFITSMVALSGCFGSEANDDVHNGLNSTLTTGNKPVYVALGAYGVMSYSYDNTNCR